MPANGNTTRTWFSALSRHREEILRPMPVGAAQTIELWMARKEEEDEGNHARGWQHIDESRTQEGRGG